MYATTILGLNARPAYVQSSTVDYEAETDFVLNRAVEESKGVKYFFWNIDNDFFICAKKIR